jgi:hypothetical protein
MTGTLTYAAQQEHLDHLRAAAEKRRRSPRALHGKRRLPAFPGLRRARRAFA